MEQKQEVRREYIEAFAERLYTKFEYLFKYLFNTDSIDVNVIKQKAVDKYLNSNMSIDDITTDMGKTIEELHAEYNRQKRLEEENNMKVQVEEQPKAIVEPIVDNNVDVPNTTYNYEEQPKAIVEPIVSTTEPIANVETTVDNELSAMISEIPKKEVVDTNSNNLEKPKQYVKVDKDIQQAGSISLFNIVLAILSISTFILIAMILNVLLK